MPICEECKKEVSCRVTYTCAAIKKHVCKECSEKLSTEDYLAWCDIIMNRKD